MAQNQDPSFKGQTDWNEEARKQGGADVNKQGGSGLGSNIEPGYSSDNTGSAPYAGKDTGLTDTSGFGNPSGPQGQGQSGYPQGGQGDYGQQRASSAYGQSGSTGKSPGGPNSNAATDDFSDPGSPAGSGMGNTQGSQFGGGFERGSGQGSGMGTGSSNQSGTPGPGTPGQANKKPGESDKPGKENCPA